jgi:predicted flap endonuclease-1-like 5' DNA nuclease
MTDGTDTVFIISIVVAVLAVAVLAFILVRASRAGKNRAPILTERAKDERPYVRQAPPAPAVPAPAPPPAPAPAAAPASPGAGVADEMSTAARDVVSDILNVDGQDAAGGSAGADDLQKLKGCGPKLAARLHELGITRYAQLASLGATEIAMLDEKLGPFRGRIARDRLAEQADYLARGDKDGFEERFGKLGG